MGAIHQALLMAKVAGSNPIPAVVGQALLYPGNGGTQSITDADFSPDLIWIKQRDVVVRDWRGVDSVRGAGKAVPFSGTGPELTEATGVTSIDANGFSVGADADYNTNAANYVAYVMQLAAGAVDIVTYAGTGVAHTVNHNLGVIPELIMVFDLTSGGNHAVYPGPVSSPETKVLLLNSAAGTSSCSTCWNNTAPTSAVFTVGTAASINTNGNNYVAYLFASVNPGLKIGSYTGDGNANGPSISIGFQTKFAFIKRTDASGAWVMFDDQRDSSSPHNTYSLLNSTTQEAVCTNTAGGLDMAATTIQSIDSDGPNCAINVNGATYIYMAVA